MTNFQKIVALIIIIVIALFIADFLLPHFGRLGIFITGIGSAVLANWIYEHMKQHDFIKIY
jgi:uncharacterized membrane protein YeaQ/YmgE (transglycosylase-associated protein family)